MKKVLVVIGSEDGNLGVYTNVKNAYDRALDYFNGIEAKPNKSYAQVCKATKGWGCTIDSKNSQGYNTHVSVTIEVHYLNQ
jgi:hypothetical protein